MSNAQSIETTDQAKDDSSECCISGVCDYHNARNIAAAHAAFVADARKHWVPVARWLRTQREWDALRLRRWDREVEVHVGWAWDEVVVDGKNRKRQVFQVDSVKQAIDHLVTAKVLPVELASWAPNPLPAVVYDRCGGSWVRCEDRYSYRGYGTGIPLSEVTDQFGPLTGAVA